MKNNTTSFQEDRIFIANEVRRMDGYGASAAKNLAQLRRSAYRVAMRIVGIEKSNEKLNALLSELSSTNMTPDQWKAKQFGAFSQLGGDYNDALRHARKGTPIKNYVSMDFRRMESSFRIQRSQSERETNDGGSASLGNADVASCSETATAPTQDEVSRLKAENERLRSLVRKLQEENARLLAQLRIRNRMEASDAFALQSH